ncbi:MAG: prepilin-type N-terminal cleavage/methylation domain-containing protein [Patescibacteria group bacterium]|nr:prepilin-type N-terminal cleavage/methylation domain-containing protein [Patescibacteria group bacterium]
MVKKKTWGIYCSSIARTSHFVRRIPRYGFTLLEILVVLTIMAVILAIGVGVLSSVLKGDAKTSATAEIKQNGSLVLDVMSYFIRNATALNGNPPCGASLSLTQPDNSVVVFSLLPTDNINYNNRIASNSASLTNGDIKTGVDVSSLTFTCDTTTSPPVVSIDFTLTQARKANSTMGLATSEKFHTSVSLRTY